MLDYAIYNTLGKKKEMTLLPVPPFKQTDDSRCGPASIKMVLGYYGIEATEAELCERCGWTYDLGCTNSKMVKAIRSYGLNCVLYDNSAIGDISEWLRAGLPVIVDWFSPGIRPGLGDMPDGHSSVVVGIDETFIYLLDPEIGDVRTIRREEFMRVWFDWQGAPTIQSCEDMVIRASIVTWKERL